MHINALPDSLVIGLMYLPAAAICLMVGLACLLLIMMVRPLIIDWLGVRKPKKLTR